jgi:O-antigen/teichoic acid export membrane protein
MFGLATYGLYTVLWALVNLVENVADLGMTSALQRVVPQAKSEEEAVAALRTALVAGILPCLAIAAIASLAAPALAEIINVAAEDRAKLATGIRIFAWALPLWAFVEIGTSSLRARRAFGPEIRLRLVWEQVIRLAAAVPLWLAGIGTLGLLIAHLASLAITALLCARLMTRYYDLRLFFSARRERTTERDTILAGLSVLPSNIVSRLFGDAPPIVLNLWLPGASGAAAAGLYGIARKLSSLVQTVRNAMTYVVGPLASSVARDDPKAVEPIYAFAARLGTVLALPVATALIAAGPAFLTLFGPGAVAAAPLLVPLVLARVVDAVTGPGGAVQQVASARTHPLVGSLIGLAVAALLGFLLIRPLGATGIAIAVAAGISISSLTTVVQLRLHNGLNPFRPPYLRVLVTGLLICAAAGLAIAALPERPASLRAGGMVAILLAALGLSARFALPLDDRRATGAFGRRLRLFRA